MEYLKTITDDIKDMLEDVVVIGAMTDWRVSSLISLGITLNTQFITWSNLKIEDELQLAIYERKTGVSHIHLSSEEQFICDSTKMGLKYPIKKLKKILMKEDNI